MICGMLAIERGQLLLHPGDVRRDGEGFPRDGGVRQGIILVKDGESN